MTYKSGFVALVGRPNTGKSTLVNALVGSKVAITSDKPQTTRRTIRGVVTRNHGQVVLVDTPGLHRPRTLLGQKLNELVRQTYADVDLIAMCIPADQAIGPGDRLIVQELAEQKNRPKIAIVTKLDAIAKSELAKALIKVEQLGREYGFEWLEIIPVSATETQNIDRLIEILIQHLPTGPALYGSNQVTDDDLKTQIAELIREAALKEVREELPHSIAVVVDEINQDAETNRYEIFASLYVERDSQKSIMIGKQGGRLKQVGTDARQEIMKLLGHKARLDLRVKVASEWQGDPKQIQQLGFDS